MTTAASLISRVRSNINEPTGNAEPQRTDTEILQWLTDGQYDYTSKIPADAVPELLQQSTFGTTYWNVPDTFVKPLHIIISHAVQPTGATLSTTLIEQCKILDIDEETAVFYWPSWAGAWAKFGKVGSTRSSDYGA